MGAVEPQLERVGRHHDRHAVVNDGERAVCPRGHDRGGVDLLAVRAHPGFPQPGKGDRRAGFRANEIRPLRRAGRRRAPFVEAVGRNEAAPAPHGVAERRLVEHRLAARIDHERDGLRVLHPGRNESPAHQAEGPPALGEADHRDRLRRRHVVARREIRLLAIAEQRPDRGRRRGDDVASAHWLSSILHDGKSTAHIMRSRRRYQTRSTGH